MQPQHSQRPYMTTEQRLAQFRELYRQEASRAEIATAFGVTKTRVSQIARLCGVRFGRPWLPPNPERNAEMLALANQGLTYTAIGARFGITKQRVHQIVKSLDDNREREGAA